jgi:hypothetical protein
MVGPPGPPARVPLADLVLLRDQPVLLVTG